MKKIVYVSMLCMVLVTGGLFCAGCDPVTEDDVEKAMKEVEQTVDDAVKEVGKSL